MMDTSPSPSLNDEKSSKRWPGPDKIHPFWYKHLPTINSGNRTPNVNKNIEWKVWHPEVAGVGKDGPKLGCKGELTKYRPIACLNSMYKLITATLRGTWHPTTWAKSNAERKARVVKYRRGLFHGNALSPLIFCLSIVPISIALRKYQGVEVGQRGADFTGSLIPG